MFRPLIVCTLAVLTCATAATGAKSQDAAPIETAEAPVEFDLPEIVIENEAVKQAKKNNKRQRI